MAANPILPRQFSELSVGGAPPTKEWYDFWRDLLQFFVDNGLVIARIDELEIRVTELEEEGGEFQIQGLGSVHVSGTPAGGVVQIDLLGDSFAPGNTFFYGTDENGNKTWRSVESALDVATGELTKDVDVGGKTAFGLADTAVTPGTYGGPSVVPVVTFDQKGRATDAINHRLGREIANFAFGDATPSLIFTAPHDLVVTRVRLTITAPFDGSGAALTIGTAGDPDLVQDASQNDPSTAGGYGIAPDLLLSEGDQLFLSITPGSGASAGAGFVSIDSIPQEGV